MSGDLDRVLSLTSANDDQNLRIPAGRVELRLYMPICGLMPGQYNAKLKVKEGVYSYDIVDKFRFGVKAKGVTSRSLYYQPRDWNVVSLEMAKASNVD